MERVKHRGSAAFEENPRFARTIDETATVLPSQRETRIHTPGVRQLKMRYAKISELGSGQFGDVYKAVDVDLGKLMAVKILRRPTGTSESTWRMLLCGNLKREVEILSKTSHVSEMLLWVQIWANTNASHTSWITSRRGAGMEAKWRYLWA